MTKWTKKQALKKLEEYALEADRLSSSTAFSTEHTRWIANCLALLEEVFGRSSRYYLSFASLKWTDTGSFVVSGWDFQAEIEERHHRAYLKQLEMAKGFLLGAHDHLSRLELGEVYEGKDTGPESSLILRILNLAEGRLRKAVHRQPQSEKELHDIFEGLLIGADIPYSRETESIEYSSKTYTPDFTVPKIDCAIDMKFCDSARRAKEIIAEINDDILAYKMKFPNLIFVVYDVSGIRDVDRFVQSFEQQENVAVRVVKH